MYQTRDDEQGRPSVIKHNYMSFVLYNIHVNYNLQSTCVF